MQNKLYNKQKNTNSKLTKDQGDDYHTFLNLSYRTKIIFLDFNFISSHELIFETIPQLYLQIYIMIDIGMNTSSTSYISIIRIISTLSILLTSIISTSFVKIIFQHIRYVFVNQSNDKTRYQIDINLKSDFPSLNSFTFVPIRSISNFFYFISILVSTVLALFVSKILVLSLTVIHVALGYALFVFTSKNEDAFFINKLLKHFFFIKFSILKLFCFFEDFGAKNFYCYCYYIFVWLKIIMMASIFCFKFEIETFVVRIDFLDIIDKYEKIFYFTSEDVKYYKVFIFIFVTVTFLIAVSIEILLKKFFIIENNLKNRSSYLLSYFERFLFWC